MAQTSPSGFNDFSKDLLSLRDVITVFNNPINEEQAWAVCHQCAQYFVNTQDKSKYQEFYKHGSRSVRLKSDGDIVIDVCDKDGLGSGKGPPVRRRTSVTGKDIKVVTECDAIQALGLVLYQALDYGMGAAEERHLSRDLEHLIEFMTNPDDEDDAPNVYDEGIEKDAKDNSMFPEVIELCENHLSKKEDAGHHYKAVCRALMAEVEELVTFLDKISVGKKHLPKQDDELRLEQLGRSDWARLWVQIMKELRRGVRLKTVERVSLMPREYELTPFEILLEDIRTRRYTLNKIMVNGNIPPKVKSDAHAVILDFIRSRPPLHPVGDRILKSAPKRELDPVEKLMKDIRSQPKLRPIKGGRLVVETSRTKLDNGDENESPLPVRKVIKPDMSLIRNFEDESEDGESVQSSRRSSVASPSPERESRGWQRAVVRDLVTTKSRPVILQRRNTITVCETPSQVSPNSPPEKCIPEIPEENENVRPRGRLSYREPVIRSPISQHDEMSRLRRTSAVHKTPGNANDLRERLKLRLHGSCTSPTRALSPVRAHVSLQACVNKSFDGEKSDPFDDENPTLNQTYPQKQVHRSASVTDIKARPRPMLRSKTQSEIKTLPQTLSSVKDVLSSRPSSTPSPTPRQKPVPKPRSSRSPTRSSIVTPSPTDNDEDKQHTQRKSLAKNSSVSDSNQVFPTSTNKTSSTPAPRPSPTPRSTKPHRSQSHRLQRHSMDFSDMDSISESNQDLKNSVTQLRQRIGKVPEKDLAAESNNLSDSSIPASPNPSSNGACAMANQPSNLSPINVRDLLNVSWSAKAGLGAESVTPTNSYSHAPSPSGADSSSKWKHPIECLSLTLDEVTHIRTVLTKAELETVISNKDLYTQLSKGKICFTCRLVKFAMFGQWGTRCKICKRNVCNNCLRKMNIPTDHFQKIPVHTLSPIPLSPETMHVIRAYESTGSVPHSPTTQRKQQQNQENKPPKTRQLQRSHTIGSGNPPQSITLPNKNLLKGPQMSICCECKGMIMEIIRTSRTSIALLNQSKKEQHSSQIPEDEKTSLSLSTLSLNFKQLFSSSNPPSSK